MNKVSVEQPLAREGRPVSAAAMALLQIPEHRLIRRIGAGAYGDVWLARNVMGTYRAVKVVFRERFSSDRPYEREFRGIQRFEPVSRSHEGLVDVLQFGRNDEAGYFYYVMELADDACVGQAASLPVGRASLPAVPEGEEAEPSSMAAGMPPEPAGRMPTPQVNPEKYIPKTLAEEVHDCGRLPADECLRLSLTLTSALGHLHKHGLIHRDIKPSNIIFVNGIPKLADIGLVADAGEARSYVGTEGFIPREGPGTAQADIYGLGKVMYEATTGKDRLEFPNLPTALGEPSDHPQLLELNEVILKACEKDVRKRYQTAEAMNADLVFLAGGQSVKRLHSLERRLARLTRIGVAILLAGTIGFTAYNTWQRRENERLTREVQLLNRLEQQNVEKLISEERPSVALAHLAEMLRRDPNNGIAASRLVSILSQRTFALPLVEPLSHRGQVHFARFSPDGRSVVTAGADAEARVWDSLTAESLTVLPHPKAVKFAEFSPDGSLVVTASVDGTARVWNAESGELLSTPPHRDAVLAARFSPDGRQVVTASFDGSARVWEARTGKPLTDELRHQGLVISAQFSPDGNRVVTASDDHTAKVWTLSGGPDSPLTLKHGGVVKSAQFSPDGNTIVTASLDGKARLWDARTGMVLLELRHEDEVMSAQFSPEGERVVTASRDKTARVWMARTGTAVAKPLRHGEAVSWAQFSPDGERVVTASDDRTARVWNARTGQAMVEPLQHEELVSYAEFDPGGHRIVTASADGTARVWDVSSGEALAEALTTQGKPSVAPLSPRADRLATALDDRTGQVSPDGKWILTIADDGTARMHDARTGELRPIILQHGAVINSAQFSRRGDFIVTASADRTARVWGASTGQPLPWRLRHEGSVLTAQWSPNGDWIVTASADETARVWNARSGQKVTEPLQHRGTVHFAQFSPDGTRVVTASADGTARVWDARSGQALTDLFAHLSGVLRARFSLDGERIITVAEDKVVRVWETPVPTLPAPPWLSELAEGAGGKRFNDFGVPESVAATNWFALKGRLGQSSGSDFWTRWSQWFLADRATRKISAFSSISVVEYVGRRIRENSSASLREALQRSPTNSLTWARLASLSLGQEARQGLPNLIEASFFARRALQFGPNNPEAWWAQAEALRRQRQWDGALKAIDQAQALLDQQNWPERDHWRQKCLATRREIERRSSPSTQAEPNRPKERE